MGFHWVSITITSLRERSRVCATSTQQRLDGVPVRKIDNVNMMNGPLTCIRSFEQRALSELHCSCAVCF